MKAVYIYPSPIKWLVISWVLLFFWLAGAAYGAPKTGVVKTPQTTKPPPTEVQEKKEAPKPSKPEDDDDDDLVDPVPAKNGEKTTPTPAAKSDDGWDDETWEDEGDGPTDVPADQIYSLDRCLKIAAEKNYTIKSAHWQVEYYDARSLEATFAWFPRIKYQTVLAPAPNMDRIPDPRTNPSDFLAYKGPEHSYDFDGVVWGNEISFNTPLFTFGKVWNVIGMGPLAKKAGRLELEKAKARTAYEVKRAYYTLQLLEKTLDVLDSGLEYLAQAEKKLNEMLESKDESVTIIDRYKFEVVRADALSRLEEAKQSKAVMLRAIHVLLDLPAEAPFHLDHRYLHKPTPKPELKSSEDVIAAMESGRPEFKQLNVKVELEKKEKWRQWAYFFPDFFLSLKYNYVTAPKIRDIKNPFLSDPFNSSGLSGFIGLSYTLDWPNQIARWKQARARYEQAEADRKQFRGAMTVEAEQAYRDYEEKLAQIEVNKEGLKSGHKWVVAQTQNYSMGVVETSDVIEAIAAYFKTQFYYMMAVHEARLAEAKLESLTGSSEPKSSPAP